jgi:transmembrane sensor
VNKDEFIALIGKYLAGLSTPEEEQLLVRYYKSFQQSEEWDEATLGSANVLENKIFQRLKETIAEKQQAPVRVMGFFKKYSAVAAAIVALLLSGGVYFLINHNHFNRETSNSKSGIASKKSTNDLPPGGNKALLTLSDGSSIVLDSAQNGTLSSQGNTKILKLNAGQLVYHAANTHADEVVYNTITTPKGGQYQVTLQDGTKVWLNAASSIHFPTAFAGKERRVEVTGEVYFEVAKNKNMPFKVKANEMEIEVLGTHFNVNAYYDEASLKTTLLEGSVKISNKKGNNLLKPGEQAVINKTNGDAQVITDADVDEAIAWKEGRFQFNNADIPSVMRQIARWYDVEVAYEGNIPTDHFKGKITRNANASSVLKILSRSDEHFRIEGKKIVVTSK